MAECVEVENSWCEGGDASIPVPCDTPWNQCQPAVGRLKNHCKSVYLRILGV
jgi:hypothetical protein